MLLDGDKLRASVEQMLRHSNRCIIFSAFFSTPAAQWLVENRDNDKKSSLMIRGAPSDFLSNASSLSAVQVAIYHGISVRFSSALHAKIYAFDTDIFASSANLTGRGIALFENHNVEFGLKSKVEQEDLLLLNNLWDQGIPIDEQKIISFKEYLEKFSSAGTESKVPAYWPECLITENRDLYVSDFPVLITPTDKRWSNPLSLKTTKAYRWLYTSVSEKGWKSFGELSHDLHNAVYDDPAPYRQDVKTLLSNLLELVARFDDELVVERPRHRQIVRLADP